MEATVQMTSMALVLAVCLLSGAKIIAPETKAVIASCLPTIGAEILGAGAEAIAGKVISYRRTNSASM
jgi:outer membrane murein-binding lipoprotein Lpp